MKLLLLAWMLLSVVAPDPLLTPGAVLPVTAAQVCRPGYAGSVRNVTPDVKRRVYAVYGVKTHRPGDYEIDHLVPLELGGSNAVTNLWPQPYQGARNAHQKDALEDRLHWLVCHGGLALGEAQRVIVADWWAAYLRYVVNGAKQ